jgi:4-hydroxy-3-polyprenylbenzoate decarboxylase
MYANLRDFVAALDSAGELRRVRAPVSPVLEIAEITDRVSKSPAPHGPGAGARRTDPRHHHLGGHALLFEHVAGAAMPVLINAFGSYRRVEMALGCHDPAPGLPPPHTPGGLEAVAARLAELVKPQPPRSLAQALAALRRFAPLLRIPPKRRRGLGPCQQVVATAHAIDLTRLPLLRCWPLDGDFASLGYPPGVNAAVPGLGTGDAWDRDHRGRYITLGGVHTVHADDRDNPNPPSHNIGMYRVQLLGPRRMAMHWHVHHDGARHWRSWKALARPMPVAIALGGESVLPYAATAPMPPGMSELLLAGFLHRRGIEMVRARTVPLWVPANAEIVIEGFVSHEAGGINYDPRRDGPLGPGAVFEGPFGDHTGFYSLPDRYPILDVTAVTTRRDPIFPATIVGMPPQEDYFLGKATERLFLPLLRTILPDVEDYDLPMFGAFHNAAFLQVRKGYPLHARRVMHGVWGAGQMSWTKTIIVVDHDVDVHDQAAVLRAAAANAHPARDLERVHGPLDILDHAAPRLGAGTKLGFDATRRVPGEEAASGTTAPRPPADPHAALLAAVRAVPGVLEASVAHGDSGWLLVKIAKTGPGQGRRMIDALAAIPHRSPPYVIVLAGDVELTSDTDALFHWLAHSDAGRDAVLLGDTLYFDATPKRPGDEAHGLPVRDWPPMQRMDQATREYVTRRWGEYGIG